MAISEHLLMLSPGKVWIDRANRQRQVINTKGLAESIRLRGIMNPLIVEELPVEHRPELFPFTHKLLAGERRLQSAKELGMALVPCRLWSDLSALEAQIVELEENTKRADLTWQEIVRSSARVHDLFCQLDPDQTIQKTADYMGITSGALSVHLRVARSLGEEVIAKADSVREAFNTLSRRDERARTATMEKLMADLEGEEEGAEDEGEEGTAAATYFPSSSPAPLPARPSGPPTVIRDPSKSILHESFLTWAPRYSGPKFNLIHCDFPYGIGLFDGEHMKASGHEYSDTGQTYFTLLETFCKNLDRFCSASAHLLFWFSEKHGQKTRELFKTLSPSWVFQPYPLIWLKSDNSGIAADSRRGPRHVYETCLMATRGDRAIVKIKADAYSAPSDRSLHVSAKPAPMLKHFFEMLVDEHTSLFDPTCGGASALQAAEELGAKQVLGLEIDEEQVRVSREALRVFRSKRKLASGGLAAGGLSSPSQSPGQSLGLF